MYEIKDIINKVHCCDCLEFMKDIPDKSIDLVLTDPPYGVNFDYDQYQDTPENLKKLVDSFMPELLRIGKVVLLTWKFKPTLISKTRPYSCVDYNCWCWNE